MAGPILMSCHYCYNLHSMQIFYCCQFFYCCKRQVSWVNLFRFFSPHPLAAPCIGISPPPLEAPQTPQSRAPREESKLFAQKTLLPTTTMTLPMPASSPTPPERVGLQQQGQCSSGWKAGLETTLPALTSYFPKFNPTLLANTSQVRMPRFLWFCTRDLYGR